MNQHNSSNLSPSGQEEYSAFAALGANRLAVSNRKRLYAGLERFVNTGHSIEEYKALGKGWPTLWPRELLDERGKSLSWIDDCHALFLVFRNALRHVWIPAPDVAKRGLLRFLFGVGGEIETLENGGAVYLPAANGLEEAWDLIRKHGPRGSDVRPPQICSDWTSGTFIYVPQNDFQQALYLLFQSSWRAKVCAKCSQYYIATKPAQLYCSTACSGGVKRERTLTWWRSKGTMLRAARAKAGKKRKINRGGGKVR
jgi:hypothetical protein